MPASPLHAPVLAWYATAARDLPWRQPGTGPWSVLVSEVMLQQTPVARVLPAWQAWLERWPTPADLAAAEPGEAVRQWGRLGYPRRALRLHEAAVAIVERHGGQVPADHEALRALPGVGSYTAAAVASFAFGGRHAVVDTNVRRVHARAVSGRAEPAATLTAAETRVAEALVPDDPAVAARWAVAVMELGALVCTARVAHCDPCPIRGLCAWRAAGSPA
ncbi:A/G-specific adenine glycosylase, partial [Motilibacter deserti]